MTRRNFLGVALGAAASLAIPTKKVSATVRPKLHPVEPYRVIVPMCFYTHMRTVTMTSTFQETFEDT